RPAIVTCAPHRASSNALSRPRPVPPPVISAHTPSSAPSAKILDRPSGSLIASDHMVVADWPSAAVAVRHPRALVLARAPQTVGLRARAHRRRLSALELVAERQPRRDRARLRPDVASAGADLALGAGARGDEAARSRCRTAPLPAVAGRRAPGADRDLAPPARAGRGRGLAPDRRLIRGRTP